MQKRFITLAKARRILGKDAKSLSDEQVLELIDLLYECAESVYHKWSNGQ